MPDSLKELQIALREADVNDDALFRSLFRRAMISLPMYETDFAQGIGVSVPTIRRWWDGDVVPHPAIRKAIYGRLAEFAEPRIVVEQS